MDFPNGNNLTIHHLISHTTGIYNFSNRSDLLEWYKKDLSDHDEMIQFI